MIKPIRNEADYEATLKRIDELMEAVPNTQEFDELEVLVTLVESYEEKHYYIEAPDPIAAIKFRMEQEDLKQKDLVPIIGDSAIVSKVLKGQRKLTVEMIKNLHDKLQIPFESLFGKMAIN
ncbi:putative toxin-antitoxin system antitoxin component [Aliarcobacter faecis]|uniref:helix-turn-helix domain-containing protein n=1 Tax=Aliarcobacter faecis TaxID=1564138 RepID=UPI00047A1F56|nr:DNA-binding protein [Aliarcobacter faecis]QKF72757.1 putative toxin-antitoxin system antitoxin component [Aliarcobacter faecis]